MALLWYFGGLVHVQETDLTVDGVRVMTCGKGMRCDMPWTDDVHSRRHSDDFPTCLECIGPSNRAPMLCPNCDQPSYVYHTDKLWQCSTCGFLLRRDT